MYRPSKCSIDEAFNRSSFSDRSPKTLILSALPAVYGDARIPAGRVEERPSYFRRYGLIPWMPFGPGDQLAVQTMN
jgi:hypothetical protein